jgi:hypothetical protein
MSYQKLYQISWTQVYEAWPKEEIQDLSEARAVLARIMSL